MPYTRNCKNGGHSAIANSRSTRRTPRSRRGYGRGSNGTGLVSFQGQSGATTPYANQGQNYERKNSAWIKTLEHYEENHT